MGLKKDLYDALLNAKNRYKNDDKIFDKAVNMSAHIIKLICDYCDEHELAIDCGIDCGAEWLYQDDLGQIDALELVGEILDSLNEYRSTIDTGWTN